MKTGSQKKRSIKFRFMLFFTLFVIAICSTISFVSIKQTIDVTTRMFTARGIPIVENVLELIDPDRFEALAESLDDGDPYYEETRLRMLALKEIFGCEYLYTMAAVPGNPDYYRFIIDGSSPPDDEENFSPLGSEEDVSGYDTAFFQAMETRQIVSGEMVFQEGWGWLISSYASIVNSGGRLVGIIGCDFDASELHRIIIGQIIRGVIFSTAFIIAGLLLEFIFLRMIFVPLKKVSLSMEEIANGEGDLTVSIPAAYNDEVGSLAHCFNLFSGKLREIMRTIDSSVKELTANANHLNGQAADMIHSLKSTFSDIEGIRDQAKAQNNQAKISYDGVKQIKNHIDSLESMLSKQLAAVERSSASVNEMSAGIQAAAEKTNRVGQRYDQLVRNTESGKANQKETSGHISRIAKQTEDLINANTAISKIAARTKLLAMNAAIEAAHAGAAGMGFAVVAEEIRNLSETAAEQSKTIKQHIQEIQETTILMVSASEQSALSFDKIDTGVSDLNDMIHGVQSAMAEQNDGIQEILRAVRDINESAQFINSEADEMKNDSIPVFSGIDDLVKNTGQILDHAEVSLRRTDEMRKTSDQVLEVAGRNGVNARDVLRIVEKFRI
jgi:methyl-accepting chemotaxis protein